MEKIKFTDPETKEIVEFAVEDETQLNNVKYLLVSEGAEEGECDAYIMKEVITEGEDCIYEMIEDEVEFNALAKIFAELADEDIKIEF